MRCCGRRLSVITVTIASCVFPSSGNPPPFELSPPSAVRGSATVEVENATYSQLCSFRMWPAGGADPGGNWIDSGRAFSPNSRFRASEVSVGLKPGEYQLVGDTCPTTTYEQFHVAGKVDVEPGKMRLVIDYDRPRNASQLREVRLTIPLTPWARQQIQNEQQRNNAPSQPWPAGPADQGCISGACDPNGTPCCGGDHCIDDPSKGFFCE